MCQSSVALLIVILPGPGFLDSFFKTSGLPLSKKRNRRIWGYSSVYELKIDLPGWFVAPCQNLFNLLILANDCLACFLGLTLSNKMKVTNDC